MTKISFELAHRASITGLLLASAAVLAWLELLPLLNALLLIPLALALAATAQASPRLAVSGALGALLLALVVSLYRPSGFHYPLIREFGALYPGGKDYSLYLNLGKGLGGYLIMLWLLGAAYRKPLRRGATARAWGAVPVGIGAVILIAHWVFGVGWMPKLPSGLLAFALVNLLVTVVAEEAFFRLLVQDNVTRWVANGATAMAAGIAVSTLLFALAHAPPAAVYFPLFALAGAVYATCYAMGGLPAAIAVHFGVNLLHFTLLEYPL